jgi:hypothetical protein
MSRPEARRRKALSLGRTSAGVLLVAAVLGASWPSRAQSSATAPRPATAASEAAPKALPPSTAASKPPSSSRKRRAACVKEGGSCASAEARCCGNLLCVGVKNGFCAPP